MRHLPTTDPPNTQHLHTGITLVRYIPVVYGISTSFNCICGDDWVAWSSARVAWRVGCAGSTSIPMLTKAWSLTCSTISIDIYWPWNIGSNSKESSTIFNGHMLSFRDITTARCRGMLGFQRNCGDPAAMPSLCRARVRQAAGSMRLVRPIAWHWKPSHLEVSWNMDTMATPNHPDLDHLRIETYGFGVSEVFHLQSVFQKRKRWI